MPSRIKELISNAIIMSADTRSVLNKFQKDIFEIKTMLNDLTNKVDAHVRDDGFDVATVKAHLAEAIELMKQIDR